jgi:hypothetical protein
LVLGLGEKELISYVDTTNADLKFARCLNDDNPCLNFTKTRIDVISNITNQTSIATWTGGLARISYYDGSSRNIKFARCLENSCTNPNITIIDTLPVGTNSFISMKIGVDGLSRILYLFKNNLGVDQMKFVFCLEDDCSTKKTKISTDGPDYTKSADHFSFAVSSDDTHLISFYDPITSFLKFYSCKIPDYCFSNLSKNDFAQSFKVSRSDRLTKAEFYIKKINIKENIPFNTYVSIVKDLDGSPSSNSSDILTKVSLNNAHISSYYGWQDLVFSDPPLISANTRYWIVINNDINEISNLYWGVDNSNGYTLGEAKFKESSNEWKSLNSDINFRIYLGGVGNKIYNTMVDGNASSNIIDKSLVTKQANASIFKNSTVNGNLNADTISNCIVGGNAAFNKITGCTVSGTKTTPNIPPGDPIYIPLPISEGNINSWKKEAEAGGVIMGDYSLKENATVGPKKITGNLYLDSNNKKLIISGTVYVQGSVSISNGSSVQCAPSYGKNSCILLTDGWIRLKNNGIFSGSGQTDSYIMLVSTIKGCNGGLQELRCTNNNSGIDLSNNAKGAIFYAGSSMVNMGNNVAVTEVTAYKINLENNASIIYEKGLLNANFSSGKGSSFSVTGWEEAP